MSVLDSDKKIRGNIRAKQITKETLANEKSLEKKEGSNIDTPESKKQLSEAKDKNSKKKDNKTGNSLNRLLNIFSETRGKGLETTKYLRRLFIQAALKAESKIFEILTEETIKALGCSQEQLYFGFPQLPNLNLLPQSEGLYIPVKNIDLFGNLKIASNSILGKMYYEKNDPQNINFYKGFGGSEFYPMNKQLNFRMSGDSVNRTFFNEYNLYYKGLSQNNLFDFTYTTRNAFNETGNFLRIFLIDRSSVPNATPATISTTADTTNKVGTFVVDYYKTIRLIDGVNFLANLINQLVGAVDMKSNLGTEQIQGNQKIYLLIQRILGLCFDNRTEIDVSGISKVSELDAIDESFWEIDKYEETIISQKVSNIKSGVVEFEGCDNIKLPVNFETLVDQLVEFREVYNPDNIEETTSQINNILDSIVNNPEWKPLIPSNLDIELNVNKSIIEILINALVATVLSPKNLLPLFIMSGVLEKKATNFANTNISGYTDTSKEVRENTDFLKNFKAFNIEVITKVGAIFLETLFELIKRDIFQLVGTLIKDIAKYTTQKKYAMILRLIDILRILGEVINLISDYRKCKPLLDDILRLLNLINATTGNSIPQFLLLAADQLSGKSPQRAAANAFEYLAKKGIPTEPLPDGSPNIMNQMILSVLQGYDMEEALNGKVEVMINPLTKKIVGKSF